MNKSLNNKVPRKLNFDIGDLFTNRQNHRGKIPLSDFKVITFENPLLSKQAVTSKMNLIT